VKEAKSDEVLPEATPDPEALMEFRETNQFVTAKSETNLRSIPSQDEDAQVLYTLKRGELARRTGISDSGETTPDNNGNNSSTVIPDNNGNNSNTKKPDDNANNRKTVRTSDGKITVTSVSTGGLVVTVSTVEQNTEDQNAVNKKLPQIWHLDVTDSGVHVTDLSENPIKAVLPFTIPENWGDPAKIDNDSLYAVFADESGNLTAYSAEYDPEAGEVSFETEQTGDFVIAKFEYEDMPFTEDFYRKLADLEEIRLFLASIKE
jgi:hypothetical protein